MSVVQFLQGAVSSSTSAQPAAARPRAPADGSGAGASSRSRAPAVLGNTERYRDRDATEAAIERSLGRFDSAEAGAPSDRNFSAPLSEEEEDLASEGSRRALIHSYADNAKRLDRLMAE